MTDPVAHHRESLHGWITSAPADVIRALMKVRRNLDTNIRKPSPPSGWRPLAAVAKATNLHPGHLARLCREVYSAQELARICTVKGRRTWCLSPEACATLAPIEQEDGSAIAPQPTRATDAPTGEVDFDRSTSGGESK